MHLNLVSTDPQNPKDYFVLLRTETLECYSNAAEAERASRRSNLQLQLRNCILIQSLKKEKVKHGFSLLIVPDGMYVMSAVSETEKTSWLNEIRDTIACQVKGDMEMMNEPMNPGTERKRKKSFSGSNEKSGHRLRLHRNRKKDTSSSVDDLERFNSTSDLDSSTFQQFRNLRSNSPHLGAKITNSVISLQDRRSRGSDFVTGGSRVNMQPSSVDLRSGHRRSEPTENEARKLIQSPQIQRPGSTSR
ncbi:unnamed protein product, partial [Echinostoma caproni]|uniref:PH domain-containing protein n=1 Tax=Echinostoma caproni TaxID=27848 RepID=A0A183AAN8_9TREM